MGLPLFVAPVESDLPSKSAAKHGVTSPHRSTIRRSASGWRDTRVANVRRGALRLYGTGIPSAPDAQTDSNDSSSQPRRSFGRSNALSDGDFFSPAAADITASWADNSPHILHLDPSRPMSAQIREAILNSATSSGSYELQRQRLQELLNVSLHSHQHPDNEDVRPPEHHGSSTVEPDGPLPAPHRRTRPSRLPSHFLYPITGPPHSNEASSQTLPNPSDPNYSNFNAIRLSSMDREELGLRSLRSRGRPPRHNRPRRVVDGLGDRDRSLSPEAEVWDTLLTTLTPDPQPPSANSSFASGATSQTAAPSSTTTPSSANVNPAAEPPCDSGCENSDGEEGDQLANGRTARRPDSSQPASDQLTILAVDLPSGQRPQRNGRPVSAQQSADAALSHPRRVLRDRVIRRAAGAVPLSRLLHPVSQDGWVGRMLVGASDEEQGDDGARQNREGSDGQNASGGDEDLSGMQRIIRNLSWREDIPEEWWAEAGLRRTLPPDTEFT